MGERRLGDMGGGEGVVPYGRHTWTTHMGVAYAGVCARGMRWFRFWLHGDWLEGSQGADPKDEDCEDGDREADGVEVEDRCVGPSSSPFLEEEVGYDEGDCGEE